MLPTAPRTYRNAGGLDLGALVGFVNVERGDTPISQWSRPSSSGSSDREVVVRLRKHHTGVYRIVRIGSSVRDVGETARPRDAGAEAERVDNSARTRKAIAQKRKRADDTDAERAGDTNGETGGDTHGDTTTRGPAVSDGGVGLGHATRGEPTTDAGEDPSRRTGRREVEVEATQVDTIRTRAELRFRRRLPNTPEDKRKLMVKTLLLVANGEVAREWKDLLALWRVERTVADRRPGGGSITREERESSIKRRTWLEDEQDWDGAFVALYDRVKMSQVTLTLQTPRRRLQMADLGERYRMLQGDAKVTGAQPARVVAKEEMYAWLKGRGKPERRGWNEFTRDIKYWKRWLRVVEVLGRGCVALLPGSVPKTFIEQSLRADELTEWLEAVRCLRPEVLALGESLLPYLNSALAGVEPPTRRTRLEVWDGSDRALVDLKQNWWEGVVAVPMTPEDNRRDDERIGEDGWPEGCMNEFFGADFDIVDF